MFIIGLWYSAEKKYDISDRIASTLPTLGVLGTFIGFKIALGGMADEVLELRDAGIWTALNTSVIGLSGYLWLVLMRFVH